MKHIIFVIVAVFLVIHFVKFQDNKDYSKEVAVKKTAEKKYASKKIIGDKIPDWVYENTSSSDEYYEILKASRNIVFFSYADCPIGKNRKIL